MTDDKQVTSAVRETASSGRFTGPVTAAFRAIGARQHPVVHAVLLTWPAVPVLLLFRAALHGRLAVYADSVLGFDAVLCLITCLAVTPFITVARLKITKLRQWYGVWVFALSAAGLAVHLLQAGSLALRVAGSAVDWTGTLAVVLLFPMAVTSAVLAQKLLGPEWKRWQRNLMWTVCAVIAGHFVLLHAWLTVIAYGECILPAILLRNSRVRKSVRSWRAGGYSTGGWWTALAVISPLALSGLVILVAEEVSVIASAVTLT